MSSTTQELLKLLTDAQMVIVACERDCWSQGRHSQYVDLCRKNDAISDARERITSQLQRETRA